MTHEVVVIAGVWARESRGKDADRRASQPAQAHTPSRRESWSHTTLGSTFAADSKHVLSSGCHCQCHCGNVQTPSPSSSAAADPRPAFSNVSHTHLTLLLNALARKCYRVIGKRRHFRAVIVPVLQTRPPNLKNHMFRNLNLKCL